MSVIDVKSLVDPVPPARFSLFALGFRPFFLAAALAAIVLLPAWAFILEGGEAELSYYGNSLWHAHEMLFGFAAAVIAGFLLTAVGNWTGRVTLTGLPLAALVGLWLAGRVAPLLMSLLPPALIAVIDLAFLPLLALVILIPILRSNKRPQLIFVAMLLALASANLLIHLQALGLTDHSAEAGVALGLNSILLIIMVMAGRVMPFFIERGAPGCKPRKRAWLERVSVGSMLAMMLIELNWPDTFMITLLCVVLALAHGLRLAGWHGRPLWRVPLLWVLYIGYGCLVLGFAVKAVEGLVWLPMGVATHVFAAAIAILCLGMMARVSLGHTGRALQPAALMSLSFVLLILAMLARVVLPLLFPTQNMVWGMVLLWMVAFAIFVWVYLPVLIRARVDGRLG